MSLDDPSATADLQTPFGVLHAPDFTVDVSVYGSRRRAAPAETSMDGEATA
jgi:hypothetical protein